MYTLRASKFRWVLDDDCIPNASMGALWGGESYTSIGRPDNGAHPQIVEKADRGRPIRRCLPGLNNSPLQRII